MVLNQIKPQHCSLVRCETDFSAADRASIVVSNAAAVGVTVFIANTDICEGHPKLNLCLLAQLFATCHGLTLPEGKMLPIDGSTPADIESATDSREERTFRMWINSLNLEGVYVNNVFADLQDGCVLLRLIDVVKPGSVAWKK